MQGHAHRHLSAAERCYRGCKRAARLPPNHLLPIRLQTDGQAVVGPPACCLPPPSHLPHAPALPRVISAPTPNSSRRAAWSRSSETNRRRKNRPIRSHGERKRIAAARSRRAGWPRRAQTDQGAVQNPHLHARSIRLDRFVTSLRVKPRGMDVRAIRFGQL